MRYVRANLLCICGIWASPLCVALSAAAATTAGTEVDASTRQEVLEELARRLESQYVVVDVGKNLAEMVRAKQQSNAYQSISQGPELTRAGPSPD